MGLDCLVNENIHTCENDSMLLALEHDCEQADSRAQS